MATKANDIFRKQQEILQRIDKQVKTLRKGGSAVTQQVVSDKQELLAGLERRLTRAKEAKERELARLDKDIEVLEGKVKVLKKEIEKDIEIIGRRGGGGGSTPGERPRRSLTKVRGIGEVAAEKLRAHGITDIATLAKTKSDQLAEILGTSAKRAREIIAAAKGEKG